MFNLTARFAARRRKWSVTLEGVDTSSFGEKRPRRSPQVWRLQRIGSYSW